VRLRSLVASSAAALLYISGVAAPAEAATSSYGYFGPVAGHNYRDYSEISSVIGAPSAASTIQDISGGPVGAGWMGVLPRSFVNDNLCYQPSDYYYNPNGTQYVLSDAANASCGPGPYSSQGVVKAWNGTSYGAWYTFSSPFQNF